MIWGLSGKPVSPSLLYGGFINRACEDTNFPPAFAYAIAYRETIIEYPTINPQSYVSADGGHGVFQLTSSWPDAWSDVYCNAQYAITQYLLPAVRYWHGLHQYSGTPLIKLVAATYNEGLGNAITYHAAGNVDAGTTNHYGAAVVQYYTNLVTGGKPE